MKNKFLNNLCSIFVSKSVSQIGTIFGRIFGRKFRPMRPNIRFRPKLDLQVICTQVINFKWRTKKILDYFPHFLTWPKLSAEYFGRSGRKFRPNIRFRSYTTWYQTWIAWFKALIAWFQAWIAWFQAWISWIQALLKKKLTCK